MSSSILCGRKRKINTSWYICLQWAYLKGVGYNRVSTMNIKDRGRRTYRNQQQEKPDSSIHLQFLIILRQRQRDLSSFFILPVTLTFLYPNKLRNKWFFNNRFPLNLLYGK